MSTRCFVVARDDFAAQKRPGAIWAAPHYAHCPVLSLEYKRDHAHRPPLCIRLPDGTEWPIDFAFHGRGEHGWTITGEAPNLTAQPSVDAGTYHGWLQGGMLSDDLAGRTYDDPDGTP